MREITVTDGYFDRKGIGEVFKYAVKFSTLDVPHLVELIELQHTRKYHFFSTYGIFRGWKLDSKPTNEDKNFVEKTFEYFEDEYLQTDETEQTIELPQKNIIDISEVVEQMETISI